MLKLKLKKYMNENGLVNNGEGENSLASKESIDNDTVLSYNS